mmetsp:Transcript_15892/g.45269  ORF Transcript_15892/g.45269 Transcript_15892/m.45269 type:complete len:236 (+) Transcript_15892:185-892(+)
MAPPSLPSRGALERQEARPPGHTPPGRPACEVAQARGRPPCLAAPPRPRRRGARPGPAAGLDAPHTRGSRGARSQPGGSARRRRGHGHRLVRRGSKAVGRGQRRGVQVAAERSPGPCRGGGGEGEEHRCRRPLALVGRARAHRERGEGARGGAPEVGGGEGERRGRSRGVTAPGRRLERAGRAGRRGQRRAGGGGGEGRREARRGRRGAGGGDPEVPPGAVGGGEGFGAAHGLLV